MPKFLPSREKIKKLSVETKQVFSTLNFCVAMAWRASPFYTLARLLAQALPPLLGIVAAMLGRDLMNLLVSGKDFSRSRLELLAILLYLLLVSLLRLLCQRWEQYASTMHGERLQRQIALRQMNMALKMDLSFFDNPDSYDKLLSSSRDSLSTAHLLWNVLTFLSSVVSFLAAFSILARNNRYYGLFMLAAVVPSAFSSARFTKVIYGLSMDQINDLRQLNYLQGLSIDRRYAQDFRLFSSGNRILKRYSHLWERLFSERKKISRERSIWTTVLDFLPEAVMTGIGFHIASQILEGRANIGEYALYTGLIAQLWQTLSGLCASSLEIYDNRLRFDNMQSLEKMKNSVMDGELELCVPIESIEFVRVGFRYPLSDFWALRELSFRLSAQEKLALVGLNGSGKTTLIKLLLRMYDPEEGSILINGVNIKTFRLDSLRAQFSVYFQDMQNFAMTLRDNFSFSEQERELVHGLAESAGPEDAEFMDKRICAALRAGCCEDILEKAYLGLEHPISRAFQEEGLELSGGQLQKLALARTLFRRRSVIILDEPSANLDPEAEHFLFDRLKEETDHSLTLFTSHRLSNVFLADRIIVLEKGRMVEQGSHEELMKEKKRYAELFCYQREKFLR